MTTTTFPANLPILRNWFTSDFCMFNNICIKTNTKAVYMKFILLYARFHLVLVRLCSDKELVTVYTYTYSLTLKITVIYVYIKLYISYTIMIALYVKQQPSKLCDVNKLSSQPSLITDPFDGIQ